MPEFVNDYQLEISFPKWIDDITIIISEYSGTVTNTTEEQLNQILNAILSIEFPILAGVLPQNTTLNTDEEDLLTLLIGIL